MYFKATVKLAGQSKTCHLQMKDQAACVALINTYTFGKVSYIGEGAEPYIPTNLIPNPDIGGYINLVKVTLLFEKIRKLDYLIYWVKPAEVTAMSKFLYEAAMSFGVMPTGIGAILSGKFTNAY